MKYVIEGQENETEIKIGLRCAGNDIALVAFEGGSNEYRWICKLTEDGKLALYTGIPARLGFQLDKRGRLVVKDELL